MKVVSNSMRIHILDVHNNKFDIVLKGIPITAEYTITEFIY
jgi:hypothetical protein